MSKRLVILLVVFACATLAGATGYALTRESSPDSGSGQAISSPPNHTHNDDTPHAQGEAVTKTGTFGCMSKSGDGPQTMECAFGLTLDDGTVYGLSADDPMLIGTIPTNTRIELTGRLNATSNKQYDTAGTIEVQSVVRL